MTDALKQDLNFIEWMRNIESTDSVSEELKYRAIRELRARRHVIIVDARQFYTDLASQLDPDHPFVICTRESPLTLLDAYPDVSDAVSFCKERGVTWETCLYPTVSQRIQ